jgi:hypothetical protein
VIEFYFPLSSLLDQGSNLKQFCISLTTFEPKVHARNRTTLNQLRGVLVVHISVGAAGHGNRFAGDADGQRRAEEYHDVSHVFCRD